MMKNLKRILIIIILIISFSSCKKEENIDENKPSSSNYVCVGVKDLTIGEIYEDELEPYTYIDYNFTIEESGYYNVSTITSGYDKTYPSHTFWTTDTDRYFYKEHYFNYLLWDNTINQMANILWIDKLKMHYFVKEHDYTITIRFNASDALKIRYATGPYESIPIDSPIKTYKIQVQKADYGLDRLWDYEEQYFIFEPEESGIYLFGSYGDETIFRRCDITNNTMFNFKDTNYIDVDIENSWFELTDDIPFFKKGKKYLLKIFISSSNEEEYIFNPKLSLITEETDNLKKITIEKTGIYYLKQTGTKPHEYKYYDEGTEVDNEWFTESFIQLYEGVTFWYVVDDTYGLECLEYTGYNMEAYVDDKEIISGHSYNFSGKHNVKIFLTYNGERVKCERYVECRGSTYCITDLFDTDESIVDFSALSGSAGSSKCYRFCAHNIQIEGIPFKLDLALVGMTK